MFWITCLTMALNLQVAYKRLHRTLPLTMGATSKVTVRQVDKTVEESRTVKFFSSTAEIFCTFCLIILEKVVRHMNKRLHCVI